MKILSILFNTLVLVCLFVGCQPAVEPADVVYQNGKILTMTGDKPEYVQSIATQGRFISAIGSTEEVSKYQSSKTVVVDLDGKTLMPGFVEPHLHPLLATLLIQTEIIAFNDWNLPHGNFQGSLTPEAYWRRLEKAAQANRKDDVFLTWGFHQFFHGEITRKELDEKFPEQPIVLWQYSFHELILNSAAIKKLKIPKEKALAHHQVQWEKGRFFETGMHAFILPKLIPRLLKPENAVEAMALAALAIEKGGVTTVADMAMPLVNFALEHKLNNQVLNYDSIDFRTIMIPNPVVIMGSKGTIEDTYAQIDTLERLNTDKLRYVKQIKLLSDGAFYALLMRMNEPYLDGHEGEWMTEPNVYKGLSEHFWKKGYQIHVHVNGDAGLDFVLNDLEQLEKNHPREDHRFTLHHLGYFRPDQAQRMKALKASASIQPYYIYAMGEKYAEVGLGEERAHRISAVGDLIENGINTSLHSDFFMAPAEPLTLAWAAVNRQGIGGTIMNPNLRISVWEAMKAITINGAYQLQLEDEVGTLKVGKKADFVILDQNPLEVDPMQLNQIQVVRTVFEGNY